MNVGDPKKAIVLSIIAVIIVSVAVFRAIPSGGPAVPPGGVALRQAETQPAKEVKAEEAPVPTTDAFSHPNLGKIANPETKEPAKETPPPTLPTKKEPPIKTDWEGLKIQTESKTGETLPDPAGNTGNSQQPNVGEAVLVVRLDAIVRSDTALAALTIAGKTASPCAEGTMINGHIKVIRIKDSSVVIEVMKRRFEIFVGQEVTL